METKICTKCGRELPLDSFHWRNKAKGTRRSECKDCHNAVVSTRNARNRTIINDLKKQGCCAKCGESRFYLLDYHHIDPSQKDNTIARMMVHYNVDSTIQEIEKCVLLCSNCHREFHYLEKENNMTIEEYLR